MAKFIGALNLMFFTKIPAKQRAKVVIQGFDVTPVNGEFAIAKQGSKEFFIDEQPRFYRLFPKDERGRCRTDQAIRIPKE